MRRGAVPFGGTARHLVGRRVSRAPGFIGTLKTLPARQVGASMHVLARPSSAA